MGKSDTKVFGFYLKFLNQAFEQLNYNKQVNSIAFLGFSKENALTEKIRPSNAHSRHFYDLSLKNWDINSEWELGETFDAIICTRTAYFAKDPASFLNKCYSHLSPGGFLLCDWGLGDHWRFSDFKVGWIKNGEHEFAYSDSNYLWSCIWDKEFLSNESVQSFQASISRFGYEDLTLAIKEEVPSFINMKEVSETGFSCEGFDFLFLPYEFPQLYLAGVFLK